MSKKAIFVAATAQHVGKTTTCLGIVSGLRKRYEKVGFIKPVGQRHVETEDGSHVDKDVILFKEHFDLPAPYPDMSPVLIPAGFTRNYLDGQVDHSDLEKRIDQSFANVHPTHDYTVVEGTGHAGVGSIIGMSNADVAAQLDLEVILISTGGLGAAFDQLALNLCLFKSHGVKVRGIILNKVRCEKREMILEYIPKALKQWDIPLIGCIPYSELLHAPTMRDYELLFNVKMLAGEQHRYRHFMHERFVMITDRPAVDHLQPKELIITHASREDIITATVEDELKAKENHPEGDLERGMILTGHTAPSELSIELLREAQMPVIHVPVSSYRAMLLIGGFTAKIRREDTYKVERAISLTEENINFEMLCDV